MSTDSAKGLDDGSQITHVLNRDKKSLCDHGERLFNAINCLLNDDEQLELTQSLFKYQKDHNVFTLVRSCRELFETKRKKSLMLFMRPVIPVRDRFHYDEYHKLFFPEEFPPNTRSIFGDLIPKELMQKTFERVNKKIAETEAYLEAERQKAIEKLEKTNIDLNLDIEKILNRSKEIMDTAAEIVQMKKENDSIQENVTRVGGFRIIDLEPNEDESLGFGVCLGPTKTFIMVSYVEPDSLVDKLGMKVGDEVVSVNEISLKMTSVDEAIDILSNATHLRVVLQTSGFMPELEDLQTSESDASNNSSIDLKWVDPWGLAINAPSESDASLRTHVRKVNIKVDELKKKSIGITIRGGIDYELGIFIVNIERNSPAFGAGLRVGDHLLSIDGCPFSRTTHKDAVNRIRTCVNKAISQSQLHAKFTVCYLGKLPQLKQDENQVIDTLIVTNTDNKNEFNNNNNTLSSLKNIDNNNQSHKYRFYLNEYLKSNISIEQFVYILKYELSVEAEVAENLREFIKSTDQEYFNEFMIELNFSKLELNRTKNQKQIIDKNFLSTCKQLTRLKSLGDINANCKNYTESTKNQINCKLIRKRSKSLDNLKYFISANGDITRFNKKQLDELTINNIMQNYGVPFLIIIEKVNPILGVTIEGGINTKQLIPRISFVQHDGCAGAKLKEGLLLLNVNNVSLIGLTNRQATKVLSDAFKVNCEKTLDLLVADKLQ